MGVNLRDSSQCTVVVSAHHRAGRQQSYDTSSTTVSEEQKSCWNRAGVEFGSCMQKQSKHNRTAALMPTASTPHQHSIAEHMLTAQCRT